MADSASINTYGHTGFTGTCFWIDPNNELIYVFLSNRVHPKVNNRIYQYALRKNVHQVFYDADMIGEK
jgi:CubicO group peptidase (beta-lactamase class C family)